MRFELEKLDGKEKESEHAQRRKLDRSSYENYHTQTAKNANAGALLTGLASSSSSSVELKRFSKVGYLMS